MQDFVRASMTCIRFYQAEARSYSNLAYKIDHLYEAQKHLQVGLDGTQWGTSKIVPSKFVSFRLRITYVDLFMGIKKCS